jgi:tetratricopeptide (TPR) repeat protein
MKFHRAIELLLLCAFLWNSTAQDTIFKPIKELPNESIAKAYAESYRQEAVGKYSEAIRALAEVVKTYPKTYTINYRLGWLYYCNRNYADALAALKQALQVCPSSIEALNTENLVYVARSEWTMVEAQSLKVIKIDYYNIYANTWYAVSLRMQGKYDLAIQVCRKMLTILPTSVAFLQELATTLYWTGEKIESKSIFNAALILDPNNETVKSYLKKY